MLADDRITELSPEQVAGLAVVRDEWIRHGLSTQPADRAEAERGVAEAYAAAWLEPPRVVWVDSPLAGVALMLHDLAASTLEVLSELSISSRASQSQVDELHLARHRVADAPWGDARSLVVAQVTHELDRRVTVDVMDEVGSHVLFRAMDVLHVELAQASVCEPTAEMQVLSHPNGSLDVSRLAWADYWRRYTNVALPEVDGLLRIGRSAGCWWPLRRSVVISERPTVLSLDAASRLHCEDGPAVAYRDGWEVWAWHGQPVPKSLIDPGWSVARIVEELNPEWRRCAEERAGLSRGGDV